MSDKKSKKEKSRAKHVLEKQKDQRPEAADDQSEGKAMDFGGLPNRDLKKNLGGCG